MIEHLQQRSERLLDIEEVGDKAGANIDGAAQDEFDPIGMPMHPVTSVRLRNIRQPMRRFETEGLGYFHLMPRCLWVWTLRRHFGWVRQYPIASRVWAITSGPS